MTTLRLPTPWRRFHKRIQRPRPPPPTGIEAWRRRSVKVRRLRIAAPWSIAALTALVVGWIVVRTVIAMLTPDQTGDEIRMSRPKFYGRDDHGQPYVIAALRARRDIADPDLVLMSEPDMTLSMTGSPKPGRLRGHDGVYNEASHVLAVSGDVVFEDGDGNVFHSQKARIDTLTREVEGHAFVTGDGPMGHTQAQSYAVHDKGVHVVFTGDVHSHLINDRNGSSAVK